MGKEINRSNGFVFKKYVSTKMPVTLKIVQNGHASGYSGKRRKGRKNNCEKYGVYPHKAALRKRQVITIQVVPTRQPKRRYN